LLLGGVALLTFGVMALPGSEPEAAPQAEFDLEPTVPLRMTADEEPDRSLLPVSAQFSIAVHDALHAPLAEVQVSYYLESTDRFLEDEHGVTDAGGVFHSPLLGPGIYRVCVEKLGFARSATVEIGLPAPVGTTLEFQLEVAR